MSAAEPSILDQALDAMTGCARRLRSSHAKLDRLFPLDAESLESLTAKDEEADALITVGQIGAYVRERPYG